MANLTIGIIIIKIVMVLILISSNKKVKVEEVDTNGTIKIIKTRTIILHLKNNKADINNFHLNSIMMTKIIKWK